ncbi:hypothetical protein D3C85_667750 [compost metagenome]
MGFGAEDPCPQRLYRCFALAQGGKVGEKRQVPLQLHQLALVVEVLVEQGQGLALGRRIQLLGDIAAQALDAAGQGFLTLGAEEVVEDAPDILADQQVAGRVEAEAAVHLGPRQ